jgi:hypothetical protein
MAIAGILLAAVALVVAVGIEWLKRPHLEVRATQWQPKLPVPWVFAAVEVHNRPLMWPVRLLLTRNSAQGCEVTLEFRRQGQKALAIPEVAARWSGHPEPIKSEPVIKTSKSSGGGAVEVGFLLQYDPTMVPATLRFDVPAGEGGQEVAVAVLRDDGTAHAWGAESYAFPAWKNPNWALERQVYEVTVKVRASGIATSRRFVLDNLAPDFARFSRLQPA